MKKVICLFSVILVVSCSAPKATTGTKPLFEVLTTSEYGGGNFQFYETLTTEQEIQMLLNDKKLKGKVQPSDVQTANFVLLNMGEKNTGGYSITVESAQEFPDKIVVKVKETKPDGMATMAITNPYAIVKINSKKPIVFE
ncbi:protease complex subunit PrcB family protein [Flavobacterium silvaticum]|uniref:Protease complex subunit PrcB family protein n=1 Tax=Flavobacterium silvaticum TaxID=1852020 RepID=A0A972FNM1_9FLAO|nr:protease complex subunit PrcB family protein [Flavobacterium silvaticum]NMH29028.1 protease complex subunit PrcB family protein [Flavobacterium silvaticum]